VTDRSATGPAGKDGDAGARSGQCHGRSSRRQDDVDALAWPVFSQRALDLLRSPGEVLHPEPGELLWDTGDSYDLYFVLAGGVLLLDRRYDRVVFVVEEGDFPASWAC
jgi:thioredoxin reductase (NADPH)